LVFAPQNVLTPLDTSAPSASRIIRIVLSRYPNLADRSLRGVFRNAADHC
jgi:hypothetical protein